ncbi:MAG TPA: hypothetical protein PKY82_02065 [Pyrinomonadaceae bacterium]|nr:hypothetical protein [Pyrinomonadaceae bacterium]
MKRISIRILIAFLTFSIGLIVSGIWLLDYKIPNVETPRLEKVCNYPDYEKTKNEANGIFCSFGLSDSEKRENLLVSQTYNRFKELGFAYTPDCVDESYRFLLIPKSESSVVIRIWRFDDKRFLTVKKLESKGTSEIGNVSLENTRSLTDEEWFGFKAILSQSDFWNMPPVIDEKQPALKKRTIWQMEGKVKNTKYQFVKRYLPTEEFLKLGKYFLELTQTEREYERYWK